MADNKQPKGEKSKKDIASGGSDSQSDRSPTRRTEQRETSPVREQWRTTSARRTVEREDSGNRSAAMDPAVAAQLKMLVQETVSAMMLAWRQGLASFPS